MNKHLLCEPSYLDFLMEGYTQFRLAYPTLMNLEKKSFWHFRNKQSSWYPPSNFLGLLYSCVKMMSKVLCLDRIRNNSCPEECKPKRIKKKKKEIKAASKSTAQQKSHNNDRFARACILESTGLSKSVRTYVYWSKDGICIFSLQVCQSRALCTPDEQLWPSYQPTVFSQHGDERPTFSFYHCRNPTTLPALFPVFISFLMFSKLMKGQEHLIIWRL